MSSSLCSGCGVAEPSRFFELPRVPADVGSLSKSETEARNVDCGSIRLRACSHCGLVSNQLYDHKLIGFKPGYEVSLKHSKVFQDYICGVRDRLIQRYGLNNKRILEIGCGGGDFLRMLCAAGANHGVGIDPTVTVHAGETTLQESLDPGSITLIQDYYSKNYEDHIGDFVCCLSVFEDIPEPLDFLLQLRSSIGERTVPLYFEVFNGYRAICQREVWSIHYEQCNYFSLNSLTGIFKRAGFEILDAGPCYQGDQYLFVEAQPGDTQATRYSATHPSAPTDLQSVIEGFSREYQERCERWQSRFAKWREDHKRVVVWGSGGKGISFLSAIPLATDVDYVVDVNPQRQGHHIPLSGHAIAGPERLTISPPDVVILTNVLYRAEIVAQLGELGVECEILVA